MNKPEKLAIKSEQARETGNMGDTRHRTKKNKNKKKHQRKLKR
jgi:hypothetical protein